WYGGRVAKSDSRPEAYGSVDEAASAPATNSSFWMRRMSACGSSSLRAASSPGRCPAAARNGGELHADILRIQTELFVAGAELATAPEAAGRLEPGVSKVTPEMIAQLEQDIDRYMDRVELPPKFVIPGGGELSARLDVARAALRRAERRVSALG